MSGSQKKPARSMTHQRDKKGKIGEQFDRKTDQEYDEKEPCQKIMEYRESHDIVNIKKEDMRFPYPREEENYQDKVYKDEPDFIKDWGDLNKDSDFVKPEEKLSSYQLVPILYCQPCELEDKCKEAFGYCQTCVEHLCEECYRTHRRPATSRNHVLLAKFLMPKTKVSGQSPIETCEKHEREDIKYLCEDHQALGCSACITIDHRTCKVLYISEVAKDFVNSQEYKRLLLDVERAKQNYLTAKQDALKQVQEIQAEKQTITNKVRAFRKEINSKLDQWERALLEENDSVHDKEVTSVGQTISKCEEELQNLGKIEENLKRLQTSGNNTRLFIQAQKDQHSLRQYKSFVTSRYVRFQFTQNKNTAEMLSEANGIGSCQKCDSIF